MRVGTEHIMGRRKKVLILIRENDISLWADSIVVKVALCQKRTFVDFISGKFFSRQNRKNIFINSVKVGLRSTSNTGDRVCSILVPPTH